MEKAEQNIESINKLEDSQDNNEQPTGGGAFYVCGVKDCIKQFVGKKKEETAKRELLPHIQEVHQDVYALANKDNKNQQEIVKALTKAYLKKSRREQKKNYYCKICPVQDGERPRFSQVENVHQRSGLEAHVKRQHPEFWENQEQKQLMEDNQIKWMNQWCGYDGPAKTKGGRPNKKFISEKYNTEKDDQQQDSQLDEDDEKFFLSIGIDVQRNKRIGTEEYQKHLEISHELFNNKEKIQNMNQPSVVYDEPFLLNFFTNIIEQAKIAKIENLLHLIKNQKGDDENSYPENCKTKIQEILRICLFITAQQICKLPPGFQIDQGLDYQLIVTDFKQVQESFAEFISNLLPSQQIPMK